MFFTIEFELIWFSKYLYIYIFQKSTENEENMHVHEDVFSSANDLSTQEVQEVVDNLTGSPECPSGCEVIYTRLFVYLFLITIWPVYASIFSG